MGGDGWGGEGRGGDGRGWMGRMYGNDGRKEYVTLLYGETMELDTGAWDGYWGMRKGREREEPDVARSGELVSRCRKPQVGLAD